jgi:predicted nucleic acid-binding Zn ribbon protein
MRTKQIRVLRNYKTRDGRIVPIARVTPKRCYRLLWLHCAECGAGFWAVRSDAVTCSDACRARRHRRWKRDKAHILAMQESEPLFSFKIGASEPQNRTA